MTNKEFDALFNNVIIPSIIKTRNSGGEEYARDEENIFANFQRISDSLDITVEECIMVYAMKHIDGIVAHVQGTTSQREDVRGRLTDLIVYMCLLWAYLVKDEKSEETDSEERVKFDFNETIEMTDALKERLNNAVEYDVKNTDATNIPTWNGCLLYTSPSPRDRG